MFAFDVKLSSTVRVDQPPPQASPPSDRPLSANLVDRMQRYWDATNYLTAAQFYLKDNPLLRRPLSTEDFKPRLLGHLGHIARAKFHLPPLNRLITERDISVIVVIGPGHGGPRAMPMPISRAATPPCAMR